MSLPTAIDHATQILTTQWNAKKLEGLRKQARTEATGIAYEAIREPGGQRIMMAMCITGQENITVIQKVFQFDNNSPDEDWTKLSLTDVTVRAMRGNGFAFEGLTDASGAFTDILLVSTEPKSMRLIEKIFTLGL